MTRLVKVKYRADGSVYEATLARTVIPLDFGDYWLRVPGKLPTGELIILSIPTANVISVEEGEA